MFNQIEYINKNIRYLLSQIKINTIFSVNCHWNLATYIIFLNCICILINPNNTNYFLSQLYLLFFQISILTVF